jgi:hypothetical protein
MRFRRIALSATCALLLGVVPTLGHHAVQAQFDFNRPPVVLKGTVKKMEWINPHTYLHLDVKDDAGKVRTWALESNSVESLRRLGMARNALKFGDAVVASIYQSRNGSDSGFMVGLTLADGRVITTWFQGQKP